MKDKKLPTKNKSTATAIRLATTTVLGLLITLFTLSAWDSDNSKKEKNKSGEKNGKK